MSIVEIPQVLPPPPKVPPPVQAPPLQAPPEPVPGDLPHPTEPTGKVLDAARNRPCHSLESKRLRRLRAGDGGPAQ